jgi:hypothetical protein
MVAALFLAGSVVVASGVESASDLVSFNHQIRPLLSDRCFSCHGPDERARKARLRLDVVDGVYDPRGARGDRFILVPGKPEASELYLRITAEDETDLMPPPESHRTLVAEEKALIRLWIEQGAEYQPHWAFIPVAAVTVPQAVDATKALTPIDRFVQARLAREGLSPAPVASRESLIRRLRFDLTGLPPSLEEIDAFVADDAVDAYERLVDRLLGDPAYGERRANEWLDLARYADTYGYQSDVEVDLSPWRDWVIGAFNDNLPYDEFITWQLAGDLLPGASQDQILATAFNRLHRQTNEGGSIEEEFRTEYAADRVQTAGTAFLGLTLECARCHDHKFDPITQKDYFQMFAFFNNIDESGLYSHFTRATPSPTMLLYPAGAGAAHRGLREGIAATERGRGEAISASRPRFGEWRTWFPVEEIEVPRPSAAFDFELIDEDKSFDRLDTNRAIALVDGPVPVQGKSGRALEFSGDNLAICKGMGAFQRTAPFSFSLWLRPTEHQSRAVIFHRSRAWTDSGSRGYELVLEEMRPAFGLVHFWPGNAIQVRALEPLPVGEWSHLTITYDGSSRAEGLRLYLGGEPMAVETVRDNLFKDIVHRKEWGDSDVGGIELTLAGRFRDAGFRNGAIDDFQVFGTRLTALEVRILGSGARTADDEELFEYYLERIDPDYRAVSDELARLRTVENLLVNDIPEIMVMREMVERRPTYVLKRGAYDAPGEAVEPGAPASILPFGEDLPRDRLGLARWITDRRNPLTARVVVNRIWRSCFGRGLVATAEDFGSQGELPSHPELLDWLALRLMDSGWDLKAMFKLIVMSATYRQSSAAEPDLADRDPDNRLLARGPKHRLEAEQIRDNALAISGQLSRRIGGPSVRPYQPAGLWEESGTGKTYVQDKGEKLYRRSLYTFWRRTAPPPSMLSFDATSREVCTAKRESTSTPLQALVLLNDPQFLEAARLLAQRLLREEPEDRGRRVEKAFRLATGRRPETREREILGRLYQEQFEMFREDPDGAREYLRVGAAPTLGEVPAEQLAAETVVVSAMMNLDEFVMIR